MLKNFKTTHKGFSSNKPIFAILLQVRSALKSKLLDIVAVKNRQITNKKISKKTYSKLASKDSQISDVIR